MLLSLSRHQIMKNRAVKAYQQGQRENIFQKKAYVLPTNFAGKNSSKYGG
jgi:hypothetical protein